MKEQKTIQNRETKELQMLKLSDIIIEKPILLTRSAVQDKNQVIRNIQLNLNFSVSPHSIQNLDSETQQSVQSNMAYNLDYNQISDAYIQLRSAGTIASSILDASNLLASSIHQLTDEIERKNKLDEFYMLLENIEKYENILSNMGKLKEAYENLSIISYPLIEIDERSLCLLANLDEELLKLIIVVSQSSNLHPMKVFYSILSTCKWFFCPRISRIYISIGKHIGLRLPWSIYYYFRDSVIIRFNDSCTLQLDISELKQFYYTPENTNHEANNCMFFHVNISHPMLATVLIEKAYNSISNHEISDMYFQDSYLLTKAISTINRDIQLSNLRSLHTALRNAVRNYRMK